ncbi:MAG: hypothetical protein RR504_01490 [Christensenellaceae bacterium]
MKKEIDFIKIDNEYYGGDQNWHTHKLMKLGGCSAVCACETCMYLAKTRPDLKSLYPFDIQNLTKQDFLKFFEIMFQFLHPGIGGLTSIDKFTRMFKKYLNTTNAKLEVLTLSGKEDVETAKKFVKNAIDRDVPVMFLMLKHCDFDFDEYEWHWFNITGYEIQDENMTVCFATWGNRHCFNFDKAWQTGKSWKGGMVCAF